ncbi:hypothetical protein ACLB2K_029300 [Fragaria x ananassa]
MAPSTTNDHSPILEWQPPPCGIADVCCDTSWTKTGPSGLGVVIYSDSSCLLDCVSMNCCSASPFAAEAQAVLLGVERAATLGIRRVQVRSDALEIITQISSNSACNDWRTFPVIDEIRKRSQWFDFITWDWNPREANQAAHGVASLAKSRLGLHRWAAAPPPSLAMVLRNDDLPCPPAVLESEAGVA